MRTRGNRKADSTQTKRTRFPTQHIIKLKNWRSCGCSRSASRSWTEKSWTDKDKDTSSGLRKFQSHILFKGRKTFGGGYVPVLSSQVFALNRIIASCTQGFWPGNREQGCPSNVSLCAHQMCSSCSHVRSTYTDFDLTHCTCPGIWGLNTTSIPNKTEETLHATRKTHHNIRYYERTRGDLFACFCQPWRAEFTSSSKRANTPYSGSRHFIATWTGTQSHIHWNGVLYFILFFFSPPLSVSRTQLRNQLNSKSGCNSQKADYQGFMISLILRWWWEILWRHFTDGTTNNRAEMERAEPSPSVHRYREGN